MKKKIIFIISAGRSGSTLLCKFLGMHSKCFPLSEPQRYDNFTRKNGICSCSKEILECPFWKAVRKMLSAKGFKDGRMITSQVPFHNRKNLMNKLSAYAALFFFSKGIRNHIGKDYYKQLRNEAKLLEVVSFVSKKPILIDASKSLVRAIALSRLLQDEFEPHFIHLYRDPVSVIYSALKKEVALEFNNQVFLRTKTNVPSLYEATEAWCRGNKSNLILYKLFGISPTYIRYEAFACDPRSAFDELSKKIDIEWEDEMPDLSQDGHHMISGNPSRINAKCINPPKDEWKNLSLNEQTYIRRRTRTILNRLKRRA